MKKILIIPSWYPSENFPTSGSFFHEQSLLLENENLGNITWQVQILTTEKKWISKQRSLFYKIFPKKNILSFSNQFLTPPQGIIIKYPFCKFLTDDQNLNSEIQSILNYFLKYPEQKPDIIHAHNAFKGGIIAHRISKIFNIPFIITEHMGPFLLHKYSDFWQEEIISSLENANAVLTVSEYQKQQLLIHEIKCKPEVSGNFVDDVRFCISERKEKNTNINFLIVTFYPNFIKDIDTFFEALVLLKNNNQIEGKHFTIIGGGETSGELQPNYYLNKIKEHDLSEWITAVPKATRSEMVKFMQQTDALISTSISESFGVAICEAMLCGKPVITTLNGGVNDYISEKNAITFPLKDPYELYLAIVKFNDESSSYKSEEIRNNIQTKYGQVAFRKRMDKIYLNTLQNK